MRGTGDITSGEPGVPAGLPNWTGETPVVHHTKSFLARLMNHSQRARCN